MAQISTGPVNYGLDLSRYPELVPADVVGISRTFRKLRNLIESIPAEVVGGSGTDTRRARQEAYYRASIIIPAQRAA